MTKLKTMIAIIAISILALGAYSFAETKVNKSSNNQNEKYESEWYYPGYYGYISRWNNTDNKDSKKYRRRGYRGGYCWQ